MIRTRRFVFALAVAFAMHGGAARAQYNYPYGAGYGGYGFGGWGGTVQGSTAAGMGAFAAGAGQYNVNTAAARSMNAQTAMQWNTYNQTIQANINREHYARMNHVQQQNVAALNGIATRIRDNPNESDIEHGDALNSVLEIMTSPNVLEGSGLARADRKITARMIKGIPFRYAPEMAVICIDQIKEDVPDLLMSNDVKPEREAFVAAVKKARAEVKENGEVSPETINNVRTTGRAFSAKVDVGLASASERERSKTVTYIRNLKAFLKMLKSPNFDAVLQDLDKYKETTIGHLIAFMHTYNLRFGPAKTMDQRATYEQLYPILRAERDKVLSMAGGPATPPSPPPGQAPPPPNPGQIFQGIEDKHLNDGSR
ncbi:MAG TPA: hypothetical protein VGZ22_05020 [Isosphaeraceae bacterium]|jgi:hypothetical protein|nr:hypothetical protein [Isosphaeraceae bacterium]